MRGVTSTRVPEAIAEAANPTLENLLTHVRKFGLDRHTNGKGQTIENVYSTYKQFAKDAATEVAFSSLSEAAYVRFVTTVGEVAWEDEARKDWQKERGDA